MRAGDSREAGPLAETLRAKGAELGGRGLRAARSLVATGLAVGGLVGLVSAPAGEAAGPGHALAALLCAAGISAYACELRGRHVWQAARAALTGLRFADFAEQLRDAEPLIDLEVDGEPPAPYPLAEWKDETLWPGPGPGARPRVALVCFPLEFIPADGLEHSALEFAMARAAGRAEPRLRLLLPGGAEASAPRPRLVRLGPEGAEWPWPVALAVLCLLLLGLLADELLLHLAEPLEWAVRKRFFTVEGGRLGALTFSCGADGKHVEVDGEPERLQSANGFWVRGPEQWALIEGEVAGLAPDLLRLRSAGRAGRRLALAAAACGGAAAAVSAATGASARAAAVLGVGALAALGFGGLSCLADWASQRLLLASAARIGSALPGGARVAASWEGDGGGPRPASPLSITVSQLGTPGEKERPLPVLRADFESGSSQPA